MKCFLCQYFHQIINFNCNVIEHIYYNENLLRRQVYEYYKGYGK
jgi:hypothetical protein